MKITLWHPTERPSYIVYDWDGNIEEVGPILSADEVYCDLCNAEVPLDPAPMVEGYVLCLDCLSKVIPDWEEQATPLLKLIWCEQMEVAASE